MFPVYVRYRDDGAIFRCTSIDEIERTVEENDVSGGECEAWSADGIPLRLELQRGPHWIRIVPEDVRGDKGLIADALRSYAGRNDIAIDECKLGAGDFDWVLADIRDTLEARWKKLSPIQRFLRRFWWRRATRN